MSLDSNVIHNTVCAPSHTVRTFSTTRYALELKVKEFCIKVEVLSIHEEVNESSCSR